MPGLSPTTKLPQQAAGSSTPVEKHVRPGHAARFADEFGYKIGFTPDKKPMLTRQDNFRQNFYRISGWTSWFVPKPAMKAVNTIRRNLPFSTFDEVPLEITYQGTATKHFFDLKRRDFYNQHEFEVSDQDGVNNMEKSRVAANIAVKIQDEIRSEAETLVNKGDVKIKIQSSWFFGGGIKTITLDASQIMENPRKIGRKYEGWTSYELNKEERIKKQENLRNKALEEVVSRAEYLSQPSLRSAPWEMDEDNITALDLILSRGPKDKNARSVNGKGGFKSNYLFRPRYLDGGISQVR